jgi:hypothetical protein
MSSETANDAADIQMSMNRRYPDERLRRALFLVRSHISCKQGRPLKAVRTQFTHTYNQTTQVLLHLSKVVVENSLRQRQRILGKTVNLRVAAVDIKFHTSHKS